MSLPSKSPSTAAVLLALLLVYVVWGSTYLGIHFALKGGLSPLSMIAGARFIIAGGLMYTFLRLRGAPNPSIAQWKNMTIMGVLLLLLGNGMVVLAERSVSSGLTAVTIASVSLWMALFNTLRGYRSSKGEWLGIAIGFIGVVWLNAGSSMTASPTGLILLIIAPLSWALGSVWSRGRDLPGPFMTAAGQMLCGGVLLMITAAFTGEYQRLQVPTLNGVLALAYLISFGSIIGFSAYIWLLHNVRPALVSSYAYINPIIALAIGAGFAHERFTAHDLGATLFILLGVVIISLSQWRKKS